MNRRKRAARYDGKIRWVSDMPDTYLASVFAWLKERGVRWQIVNDGHDLWLSDGVEIPDAAWITYDRGVLGVEGSDG